MGKKQKKKEVVIPKAPIAKGEVQVVVNQSFRLDGDQYYSRGYDKKAIFLHHTAGTTFEGAFQWWNQTPDHVGTAFIIDRDGTIYEVFDPRGYAYHLGVKNDDDYFEKHSIGVELVSAGPLHDQVEGKTFYPLWPNKQLSTIIPESDVYNIEPNYKGFAYYHKYTDEQVSSLVGLLKKLILEFKIDITQFRKDFYNYDLEVVNKRIPGIWSHSTVRNKADIFPQGNLLEAIDSMIQSLL